MAERMIAISPFASAETSGHPLVDDEFYLMHLLDRGADFMYCTSPLSAERIVRKYPQAIERIKVIEPYREKGLGHLRFALALPAPRGATVVFFGYTERLVLLWYLLNLFSPFRLILVATNNISARRVRDYRRAMSIFFGIIGSKLLRLVLHTEHEMRLVASVSSATAAKCFIKRHHLLIRRQSGRRPRRDGSINIDFFGPAKPEKPLRPFAELVSSDESRRFRFRVFNVCRSEVLDALSTSELPPNVEVSEVWLTEEQYLNRLSESGLVFMSHTREFEGKLSGSLCDSVALGVPHISAPIEPLLTFHKLYGQIGYLCDFDETGWARHLLDKINQETVIAMQRALDDMSSNFGISTIRRDLDDALAP